MLDVSFEQLGPESKFGLAIKKEKIDQHRNLNKIGSNCLPSAIYRVPVSLNIFSLRFS